MRHSRASTSISAQVAPITSPVLAAVKIANSRALGARCQEAGVLSSPVPRHGDCRRSARVPAAPDGDRRSAANHQRHGDGSALLLQGHARPAGDDTPSLFVYEPRKLPRVLSPEEVLRLLEAAPSPKHKAALSVAYGAGLRAMEVVALKVCDIDSKRMMLRVEQGKGRKSLPSRKRGIALPCCRLSYWSCCATGGALPEWFKRYRDSDKPERFDRIVQSWDTANKVTELSDYSVCTTWGVNGKHLFLIGLLRRRLEYPALKRAVREQQNLFSASVVLIEDKASGTQLIQDLIAEGCHGVTRYQPTDEKTMRMHAQTAVIENGFVHLPETAPWLAEYLHELAVFPNGKHDDQADSTAQFLDWFKRPFSNQGIFELYRRQHEQREAEQRSKPQPVKTEYAKGSMEWLEMQKKKG